MMLTHDYIIECCRKAIGKGFKIIRGSFYNHYDGVCPLGAVILERNNGSISPIDNDDELEKCLEMNYEEITNFYDTIDKNEMTEIDDSESAYLAKQVKATLQSEGLL